jgi:hypothetical protein
MKTRRNFITHAAAFLFLVLAMLAQPSTLRAQSSCVCNYYTFRVASDVDCKVTIIWAYSPIGGLNSKTLSPGDTYQILCPVYEAYIVTCGGSYRVLPIDPAGAVCSPILAVPGCCVQACYGTDLSGCPTVDIKRAHCTGSAC